MRALALRRFAWIPMLVAFGFAVGGCEAIKKPKRDPGLCDPENPCDEGSVCIPSKAGALLGRCVKSCETDATCPKGQRCTGRYQKLGSVEQYCRQPVQGLGADCTRPDRGCKAGLRCFRGACVKSCEKDKECASRTERCLPVVVDTMVDKDRKQLFRACLPATRQLGQSCKLRGPFCGRNLVCHGDACVRTCGRDGDCGKGQICDGELYTGPDRKAKAKARKAPDVRYCRKAARRNRSCHNNLDVGCARGLACIKFSCRKVFHRGANRRCDPGRGVFCDKGLVCFEDRCRKPCLDDKDCVGGDVAQADGKEPDKAKVEPKRRRRRRRRRRRARKKERKKRLKCQERTYRKQTVKICI